ncbi:MAG: TonB-dependent receptor [Kiritimatiellae bacterium]|nr:TonB-dependent receptor [Kiritimatiellia bacterium]
MSKANSLRAASRALAAVSLVAAVPAFAAGFALEEGSARGNVNPASLIARGGEPGAMYFNPANIADLPGTQVQVGATFILPAAHVDTVSPYTGRRDRAAGHSQVWNIPSAYLTHRVSDDLAFGFGIFTRYGLGANFPRRWAGRYGNYKAEILSLDFAPQLAWRATDRLTIAAGISVRYFDIELAQRIDAAGMYGLRPYNDPSPSPFDVDQDLHGDDVHPAIDLGLQWKIRDDLTFGAAYHSRIQFKVRGDAKWDAPAAVRAVAPGCFADMPFNSRNYNPDKFMAALAWDATERLTLSAGFTFTTWHLYDDLLVKLERDMVPGVDELASVKEWHDAWRLSAGADYALSEEWTLRAGYTWDQSPINGRYADYLVPGDDRHILAAGLGWTRGDWTVEGSYFYEIVQDFDVKARPRSGVFDGKYADAHAHAAALSVTRRF